MTLADGEAPKELLLLTGASLGTDYDKKVVSRFATR